MSRLAGRLAVVVLALGVLAGCGIPDDTDVTVLPRGLGPSAGLSTGQSVLPTRHLRADTTDRAQFVRNYLEAAAADPDDSHVRAFLDPKLARTFKPGQDVQVIRLVDDPLVNPDSVNVLVRAQQLGTLHSNGVLDTATADATVTPYSFSAEPLAGQTGLFITHAPSLLLLTDEALNTYYQRRAIYFWDRQHTTLVPDLRYLSLAVPTEGRPNEIIKWLTTGPSPWLDGVVERLPDNTQALGNVPAVSGDKLQVNLSSQALDPEDPKALDRLRRQLLWSLWPNPASTLELKIAHQVMGEFGSTDYLDSNAAYRFAGVPERFCVYDGRIRRMTRSANPGGPVPVVTNEVNRNVQTAALSTSGSVTYAALVAVEGTRQVLRSASSTAGGKATFRTISTTSLPAPIGRPTWAVTPDASGEPGSAVGIVAGAGRLYSFAAGAREARAVDWPAAPAAIDAVAVAPDGHRIAVVAGGVLYVAVMTANGSGLKVSAPRQVLLKMTALTAVDWSSEGSLVVAGLAARSGRVAITDVYLDGVSQTDRLRDLGTARVTQLVAYPANPATGSGAAESVAYVADGKAYDVLTDAARIQVSDLVGPVPAAPPDTAPTAPFFLS